MSTMDELVEAVAEVNGKADSLIELADQIKTRLDEALSGVTLPPAVQAKVDQIFTDLKGQAGEITAAIDRLGTGATGATGPEPEPA